MGGVVFMILIAFGPGAFRQSHTVNPEGAGQLGSLVGGVAGAIFALIGVVLLYSTLTSQRDAFARQSLENARQSFENKYFELIKLHRGNVAEIELPEASGRKVFVLMLRELRAILDIVRGAVKESRQQLTQREMLQIAYYCLFFGVGPNSSRMLKMSLCAFNQPFIDAVEKALNRPGVKEKVRRRRKLGYVPFEGHQSRLGHYYRHLYQMVQFVDQRPLDINKYEYVKTIRAQLSTHEQALLLVNSLTPIGGNWWAKGDLITKYKLVKNIPRGFFDSTELDVGKLFGSGYFEWEEK